MPLVHHALCYCSAHFVCFLLEYVFFISFRFVSYIVVMYVVHVYVFGEFLIYYAIAMGGLGKLSSTHPSVLTHMQPLEDGQISSHSHWELDMNTLNECKNNFEIRMRKSSNTANKFDNFIQFDWVYHTHMRTLKFPICSFIARHSNSFNFISFRILFHKILSPYRSVCVHKPVIISVSMAQMYSVQNVSSTSTMNDVRYGNPCSLWDFRCCTQETNQFSVQFGTNVHTQCALIKNDMQQL